MKKYHIYGIGNALVDKEFEVTDAFFQTQQIEKGMMTLIDQQRHHDLLEELRDQFGLKKRASGGSAANTVIASSYFGAKAFYSCRVANDETGEFYIKDLKAAGVATNCDSNLMNGVTGKCLVMVTPDAERTMNTYLGITEHFGLQDLDENALKDSEYLYMEGYLVTSPSAREAAIHAHQMAQKHQVKTAISFSDPSMVQFFKDGLQEIIGSGVDLLFCNEAEALHWADSKTLDEAVEALKAIAKSFVITLGAKGALVYDGQAFTNIEPYSVKAVDTNGAGDMFAGAYLYALCHNQEAAKAGQLASRAAAEIVTHFGPRLPAESHQQILSEIFG